MASVFSAPLSSLLLSLCFIALLVFCEVNGRPQEGREHRRKDRHRHHGDQGQRAPRGGRGSRQTAQTKADDRLPRDMMDEIRDAVNLLRAEARAERAIMQDLQAEEDALSSVRAEVERVAEDVAERILGNVPDVSVNTATTEISKVSAAGPAPTTSCCLNGGLCVLGSFCECPKGFHGRHCESQYRKCGKLAHGEMRVDGCTMCTCGDGVLTCIPQIFCKDQSEGTDVWTVVYRKDDLQNEALEVNRATRSHHQLQEIQNEASGSDVPRCDWLIMCHIIIVHFVLTLVSR